MTADLQPMAVGRGSLAAHAPVAGADAVERVHAAARPLRGARVLHVTAAGGGRRVAESLGASAAAGRRRRAAGRVAGAVRRGRSGAGAARRAPGSARRRYRTRTSRATRSSAEQAGHALPAHDVLVLHDPGALGLAHGDRQAGGVALPRRRRAGGARRLAARPAAGRGVRGARGGRRGLRAAGPRGRGDRAGHRSAERAQRRQLAVAHRAGRALAGPRPRPPDGLPGHVAGPLEGPARDARGLRARARGAARPPAGADDRPGATIGRRSRS